MHPLLIFPFIYFTLGFPLPSGPLNLATGGGCEHVEVSSEEPSLRAAPLKLEHSERQGCFVWQCGKGCSGDKGLRFMGLCMVQLSLVESLLLLHPGLPQVCCTQSRNCCVCLEKAKCWESTEGSAWCILLIGQGRRGRNLEMPTGRNWAPLCNPVHLPSVRVPLGTEARQRGDTRGERGSGGMRPHPSGAAAALL